MSINYELQLESWKKAVGAYQQSGSKAVADFGQLHADATRSGAIPAKYKALMGLALGIAARCEGCIVTHTQGAIKEGATMEEIVETVDVALMMGGGPSYMYGGRAIECAKQFLNL